MKCKKKALLAEAEKLKALTGEDHTPIFLYDCPKCGFPTETLHEGYCEECCNENQRDLDEHNARFDWWESLSDQEREQQIKEAKWICYT